MVIKNIFFCFNTYNSPAAVSPTTYNDPDTAMVPSDGYPDIPNDRGADSIFMISNNNTMQESALAHYGGMVIADQIAYICTY